MARPPPLPTPPVATSQKLGGSSLIAMVSTFGKAARRPVAPWPLSVPDRGTDAGAQERSAAAATKKQSQTLIDSSIPASGATTSVQLTSGAADTERKPAQARVLT